MPPCWAAGLAASVPTSAHALSKKAKDQMGQQLNDLVGFPVADYRCSVWASSHSTRPKCLLQMPKWQGVWSQEQQLVRRL